MFHNLWQPFKLIPIFGGLAYAVSPLVAKEDDYVTTSDMSTIAAPTVRDVAHELESKINTNADTTTTMRTFNRPERIIPTYADSPMPLFTDRSTQSCGYIQGNPNKVFVLCGHTGRLSSDLSSIWLYTTMQKPDSDSYSAPYFVGECKNDGELASRLKHIKNLQLTYEKFKTQPTILKLSDDKLKSTIAEDVEPVDWITFPDLGVNIPEGAQVSTVSGSKMQEEEVQCEDDVPLDPERIIKLLTVEYGKTRAADRPQYFDASILRSSAEPVFEKADNMSEPIESIFMVQTGGTKFGLTLALTSGTSVLVLCHPWSGNDKAIIFAECKDFQEVDSAVQRIKTQMGSKAVNVPADLTPLIKSSAIVTPDWIKTGEVIKWGK